MDPTYNFNGKTGIHRIELTDAHLATLESSGQIKAAINRLLGDAIKQMIMQRHTDIQSLVQDVLNSPDSRALVSREFEAEVKRRVAKYVDEVYGK